MATQPAPGTSRARTTRLYRCVALNVLLGLASLQPVAAFQVCVGDVPVPPYLSGDPAHPGTSERLMIDAGRQVGLTVKILRWPARRCYEQMRLGQIEAGIAAAVPANMQEFDFPGMPEGDPQMRIARTGIVLVKRREQSLQWDGQKLALPHGRPPRVGARAGFRAGVDRLHRLGLELTPGPSQTSQVLRMLQLDRLDVAVLVQNEAEALLARPEFAGLVVLEPPLLVSDFYVMTIRQLPEAQRQQVRRWWELMAQWRDLPAYRSPAP